MNLRFMISGPLGFFCGAAAIMIAEFEGVWAYWYVAIPWALIQILMLYKQDEEFHRGTNALIQQIGGQLQWTSKKSSR